MRAIDQMLASEICNRRESSLLWADDFPQEGDLVICTLIADDVVATEPPWGAYLLIVDSTVVGTAGFKGAPRDGSVEIGYSVAPSHRRRGVATTAVRQLLDIARRHGAPRVTAEVDSDNHASQSVLIASGFTRDSDDWWSSRVE